MDDDDDDDDDDDIINANHKNIITVITFMQVRATRLFLFAIFLHLLGGHRPMGHLSFARHLPTQKDAHTSLFGVEG